MSSSHAERLSLACPSCGKSHVVEAWVIIDTAERSDLARRVIDGTIHVSWCPYCGGECIIDAPLLTYCPDLHPPLFFSPAKAVTLDQDQRYILWAVTLLRRELGTRWQDTWPLSGWPVVTRDVLSVTLSELFQKPPPQESVDENANESIRIPPKLDALLNKAIEAQDHYRQSGDFKALAEALSLWQGILVHPAFSSSTDAFKFAILGSAGGAFLQHYFMSRQEIDLDSGLVLLHQAVWFTPFSSPRRGAVLINIGTGFRERYTEHSSLMDLDHSIQAYQEALECMPDNFSNLAELLNNLGVNLHDRYSYRRDPADLRTAIQVFERATARTPFASPDAGHRLANLGRALLARHSDLDQTADLDRALGILQRAARLGSPVPLEQAHILNNLGTGLHRRYTRDEKLEDLQQAIALFDHAQRLGVLFPSDHALFLNNRAAAQRDLYLRTRSPYDLEQVISAFQQAARLIPANSIERFGLMNNLGRSLHDRYRVAKNPDDLDMSIEALREAAALPVVTEPQLASCLITLIASLEERYLHKEDLADLDEAIDTLHRVIQLTPPGSGNRHQLLMKFGLDIHTRYERVGTTGDLDAAILSFQQALQLDQPKEVRAALLAELGVWLRDRHFLAGHLDDLKNAAIALQEAVNLTPRTSTELVSRSTNLGNVLTELFRQVGERDILSRGIEIYQGLLKEVPAGRSELISILTGLATGLNQRFTSYGDLSDLDQALTFCRQAIQIAPHDAAERAVLLTNLGMSLSDHYERTDQISDLDEAIVVLRQAVDLASTGSKELSNLLNNLGNSLYRRYELFRNEADLEEAIRAWQSGVELTQPTAPDRAMCLASLGLGLLARSALPGRPDDSRSYDLQRALTALRQALRLTPSSSLHRVARLIGLGNGLRGQYSNTAELADLEKAIHAYQEACELGLNLHLQAALSSSHLWGAWAMERSAWEEASQAFGYGLRAADILIQTQLLRISKESWLREAGGLPSLAAYSLARCGHPSAAVLALEHGRARLLTESLARERANLEALESIHPDLAEAYRKAASRLVHLEGGELRCENLPRGLDLVAEMRAARAELQAAIERIREVDGYEELLVPPEFDVVSGVVLPREVLAYLLVTPAGSLALAVHRAKDAERVDISQVLIDDFSYADLEALLIKSQGVEMRGGYLPAQMSGQRMGIALEEVLPSVGQQLVGPLALRLRQLGVQRVTVVAAGRLGLLPLHAARYTVDSRLVCLLDEFEVTYAPSAQILTQSLKALAALPGSPVSLLAISDPRPLPEGMSPLAFGETEAEEIASLFGDHAWLLCKTQATRSAVQANIDGAGYLHFACHGYFAMKQPLESGLVLSNGERLTLAGLLGETRLKGSRLVVLSACQTAITDFKNLPDEVIGLPAGFLQAGVPGVVGTLWPVDDLSTMLLMVRFYRYHLRGDEDTGEGPMAPAGALRRAQLWLRDVTAGELAELFDRFRQAGTAGTRVTYELAQERLQRYATRASGERPFADPYYWAPFVFYGC